MKTTDKLNRAQAIQALSDAYGIDLIKFAKNIRVKVTDYSGNFMAPERYCYKITFTLWGNRKRFAFYPNTVGYQSY